MRSKTPDDEPPLQADPTPKVCTHRHSVIQGVILGGLGIVIGMLALVLCCYSLGLDFQSEGWGDTAANSSGLRRQWLVLSLLGFGIAIVLFWVGFFRITHPEWGSSR